VIQDDESPKDKSGGWKQVLSGIYDQIKDDLFLIVLATVAALVRAMGVTIQSGQTGLLFSFGHARRELQPGFHLLIPFLQRARRLPTRSRTLDLPSQRVASFQGLVYHVDANLVYRIIDVRKAMIQIDHLEKGMLQMLGLGVQEVMRTAAHSDLTHSETLDRELAGNLAQRLAPWGVEVERAGFPSITPSPQSLRITQLSQVTAERRGTHVRLKAAGVHPRRSLALIGTRSMPRPHTRALRAFAEHRRRLQRIRALLKQRGWNAVQIKQAQLSLLSRVSTRGRVRAISR
jgi:regulator of protease activity HflC (stomatin/prohibitin superfamily)